LASSTAVARARGAELLTALSFAYRTARTVNTVADEGENPFAVPIVATVGVPGGKQEHELQRLREQLQVTDVQCLERKLDDLGVKLRFEDDPYGSARARLWLPGQS